MTTFNISLETLNNDIVTLFKAFKKHKKQLYLVGGCVRDMLMSRTPHDYDFTTDATPEMMRHIAEDLSCEILATGEIYGTMTFKFDRNLYEVTTFRSDGTYGDGRRPDNVVFGSSLEDDLSRRDFTINAMAWSPKTDLVDLFGGQQDIERHIIRTVGAADTRFKEDALRMLRAFRFASKLSFCLDEDVYNSIATNYRLIQNVSKERIGSEFVQICSAAVPTSLLFYKMMDYIFSLVCFDPVALSCELPNVRSVSYSVLEALYVIAQEYLYVEKDGNIEVNIDYIENLKAFAFGNDLLTQLTHLCKAILSLDFELTNNYMNPAWTARQVLVDLPTPAERIALFDLKVDMFEDIKHELLSAIFNKDPLTIGDLAVNGTDMLELGFTGKSIGEALRRCQLFVFEHPEKNNKKDLIEALVDYYI